jgi:predicted nucleotidyltransferase
MTGMLRPAHSGANRPSTIHSLHRRHGFFLDTIGLRGVMTLQELRDRRREEILRVAAQRGARNVRVFGSVARGDNDEKSDVDFLVEMEPGRTLFDLSGLLLDLESLLQVSVDVVTERGLRPRVRERVLAEAVPL